jgi:hypothetical protein
MVSRTEKEPERTSDRLAQWAGLFAGPVAWILQLQIGLILIPWVCAHDGKALSLHLVTAAALLLATVGGFISWRNWRRVGKEWPGDESSTTTRSRFMAIAGLLTSAMFFLVILIQGIASFILHPCQS